MWPLLAQLLNLRMGDGRSVCEELRVWYVCVVLVIMLPWTLACTGSGVRVFVFGFFVISFSPLFESRFLTKRICVLFSAGVV